VFTLPRTKTGTLFFFISGSMREFDSLLNVHLIILANNVEFEMKLTPKTSIIYCLSSILIPLVIFTSMLTADGYLKYKIKSYLNIAHFL
jgi:hypothetical protein